MRWLALTIALVWSACFSGQVIAQATATGDGTDPEGDTIGIESEQVDITRISAHTNGNTLLLELTYLPSNDPPTGLIEIDADQDAATGAVSNISFLCPGPTGLGVEFSLDLFAYDSGAETVALLDESAVPVASVPAQIGPDSMQIQVPTQLIGGSGIIHAAAILGTAVEGTDCAPNGGYLLSAFRSSHAAQLPTLGTLALVILSLLFVALALVQLAGRGRSINRADPSSQP